MNMKFILGKKIGMSQIFDKDGNIVPVTVIEAGPCFVTQIKNIEKDGYSAVQIGFGDLKTKKVKKSQKDKLFKYIREFKIKGEEKRELKKPDDSSIERELDHNSPDRLPCILSRFQE